MINNAKTKITHDHFKKSMTSNAIQVLIIDIVSFATDKTIINTIREIWVRPIEYVVETKSSFNPLDKRINENIKLNVVNFILQVQDHRVVFTNQQWQ